MSRQEITSLIKSMYNRCLSMTSDRVAKGTSGHECFSIGIVINGETYDACAGNKTGPHFFISRPGRNTVYYENFDDLCEVVFQYPIIGVGLQKSEAGSGKVIEKILGLWNKLN